MPKAIQYIMFILLPLDYHKNAQLNRFLQSFPETTEKEKDQRTVARPVADRILSNFSRTAKVEAVMGLTVSHFSFTIRKIFIIRFRALPQKHLSTV
jgi:hypothetical protein